MPLYRVKSARGPKDKDIAVKMAAAHYGLSSALVKLAAVPTWKKQFRRAVEALESRTHAWHGVVPRQADPASVNSILRSGYVAPAHIRPDVMSGTKEHWKKAPHAGAYFSTDRPSDEYWKHGAGGVGIARAGISGEIVLQQPGGYEHELLSHGPVPLPPKAFAVPAGLNTAGELNEFRRLAQQRRLRPIHPTALLYADKISGPGRSPRPGAFERLESGLLESLKREKKEHTQDRLQAIHYGTAMPQLQPTPAALSGPETNRAKI